MGEIIAIGGGEIKAGDTLAIDKYIVEKSGKQRPNLLFVPTASRDAGGYINAVSRVYRHLGCSFSTLLYFLDKNAAETAAQKVEAADIIYVGGGNTRLMMETWKRVGFDKLLISAFDSGKLLCGLSAGSICWFSSGYSDSESFDKSGEWQFCEVEGLGLIKAINCPHFDMPDRAGFVDFMRGRSQSGIAISANCAFELSAGNCRAIGSEVFVISGGQPTRLSGEWQSAEAFL